MAEKIVRILALPYRVRPFRSVVDLARFGADDIIEPTECHIQQVMTYMYFEQLLTVKKAD